MSSTEAEKVKARYELRKSKPFASLYDPFRAANLLVRQERERAINRQLSEWLNGRALSEMRIMEVGCGSGANLLYLLSLGANAKNMIANELLEDRLLAAQENLPQSVKLMAGDATKLGITPESLDVIVQSTVFSSLLDKNFSKELSTKMLTWLKPGGCVLWYDFTYDNPKNPDVRGVKLQEIRQLFPLCTIKAKAVTLAPPIARRLCKLTRVAYPILNLLPLLRTHIMCTIVKPTK
jgi:ubiquinone/menaquinone biosynthesis C-methylase UbiE